MDQGNPRVAPPDLALTVAAHCPARFSVRAPKKDPKTLPAPWWHTSFAVKKMRVDRICQQIYFKKAPYKNISYRISWHSTCQKAIKCLFFTICSKYTWQILKAWGLVPIPVNGWLDLHLLKHSMPSPNSWINKLGPWNHLALRELRYISMCRNQFMEHLGKSFQAPVTLSPWVSDSHLGVGRECLM